MLTKDQIQRFSFDRLDIRGELVYLDESWREVLSRHDYPQSVRRQLGEALAIAALLSLTIKYDGTLILQVQGKGPLGSLVVQVTSEGDLRGLARFEGHVPDGGLQQVFGGGRIVITVIKKDAERYQSIVDLSGDSLAQALEAYFRQSEQLPSDFRLFVSHDRVAGLFLQMLPEGTARAGRREEDFSRLRVLAGTLSDDEIFRLAPEEILHRLFHEEQVRLFSAKELRFQCTCSREKVAGTLASLGKRELDSIIEEQGSVRVDCEFCNRQYLFEAGEVARLAGEGPQPPPGSVIH